MTPENPYRVLGPKIPGMLGRTELAARVEARLDREEPEHVSVVGPAMFGKSVLLREIARRYAGGRSGFVTSNLGHVVEALEWLRTHPKEAKVMGNVGKSFVEREFNWSRVSARFDESIDRILKNTDPKSL